MEILLHRSKQLNCCYTHYTLPHTVLWHCCDGDDLDFMYLLCGICRPMQWGLWPCCDNLECNCVCHCAPGSSGVPVLGGRRYLLCTEDTQWGCSLQKHRDLCGAILCVSGNSVGGGASNDCVDNKKQDQFQEEDQDWEDLAVIYYNFIGFMYTYLCTHLSRFLSMYHLSCFSPCYMYCKINIKHNCSEQLRISLAGQIAGQAHHETKHIPKDIQ